MRIFAAVAPQTAFSRSVLLLAFVLNCSTTLPTFLMCHSLQPPARSSSSSSHSSYPSSRSLRNFYADPESIHDETTAQRRPLSFEQRMREQPKQRRSQEARKSSRPPPPSALTSTSKTPPMPVVLQDVKTLDEYKGVLDDAREARRMVAVFWYSPWCKACRAAIPGIRTLAKDFPDVQFIKVPAVEENANLHQGLDVPSVPFMHLYVPDNPRLVEERRMTRKKLPAFRKLLRDYETGRCSLERLGEWSTSCPYNSSPNRGSGSSARKNSHPRIAYNSSGDVLGLHHA